MIKPHTNRIVCFVLLFMAMALVGTFPALCATFTVTTLSNAGPGTLRDAMNQAISNSGADVIEFDPTLSGTITLSAALPTLTGANAYQTHIHGETALDTGTGPDITIDAAGLGFDGIVIEDINDCVVRGLRITGCDNAIVIRGTALPGANGNVIGGSALVHRNVFSGNANGILIEGFMEQPNTVLNTHCILNDDNGLLIQDGPSGVNIGGPGPVEFNLFSSNGGNGILLQATDTMSVTDISILYNIIGLDRTATSPMPNSLDGVRLYHEGPGEVESNSIGYNVISGNLGDGVSLIGHASQNSVFSNYIGTDGTGTSAIGNQGNGIHINQGAQDNEFGPDGDGGPWNIISGNALNGVLIEDGFSDVNDIDECLIGVGVTGLSAVGNGRNGVLIRNSPFGNSVRGCTISGNAFNGVLVTAGAFTNSLSQNKIGLDSLGTGALPNGTTADHGGVRVDGGAHHNTVGLNVICGHDDVGQFGVGLFDEGTSDNQVSSNNIGVDIGGSSTIPNSLGIKLMPGADRNIVLANLVSGNVSHGIRVESNENTVTQNIVGLDEDGLGDRGNGGSGIYVSGDGNVIGGRRSDGDGNLISGNSLWGIEAHNADGSSAHSLTIQGNDIGLNSIGGPVWNAEGGIWIGEYFRECLIGDWSGGAGEDASNTVAANGIGGGNPAGILVGESGAGSRDPRGNMILTNSVFANAGEGIEIDVFAPDYGNLDIDSPTISTAEPLLVEGDTNLPSSPTPTVQVFSDSGDEGQTYLGDATVMGTTWSLVPSGSIPTGVNVTATNTAEISGQVNTSEFSDPMTVASSGGPPAVFEFTPLTEPPGGFSRVYDGSIVTSPTSLMTTIYLGGESRAPEDMDFLPTVWNLADGVWQFATLPTPAPGKPGRVNTILVGQAHVAAAGYAYDDMDRMKPVLWEMMGMGPWEATELPTLGGEEGRGGILNLDIPFYIRLTGWSRAPGDGEKAVIWEEDGNGMWTIEELPDYGSGLDSRANAVGLLDTIPVIAGYAYDDQGRILPQVWKESENGWMRTGLPLPPGGVGGEVHAINGFADIEPFIDCVGWFETPEGDSVTAYWHSMDGAQTWDVHHVNGIPGSPQSIAFDIEPFLAPIPESNNEIDAAAHVVGTSFGSGADRRATLWHVEDASSMAFDLNDLIIGEQPGIVLGTGRLVDDGDGITDQGIAPIIGWGSSPAATGGGDGPHAYVLMEQATTSAPDPTTSSVPLRLNVSPNPVVRDAFISFYLPRQRHVHLTLHDVLGRRIAALADGIRVQGLHEIEWDGRGETGHRVPGGVYFLRLRAGGETKVWKMEVLRR